MIAVVNRYRHKPTDHDIYIGRGSPFGNPYSHMDGTTAIYRVDTREEAIENYRVWFHRERLNNVIVYSRLNKMIAWLMRGGDINLVCTCAPKACHGDIIKQYLESVLYENNQRNC